MKTFIAVFCAILAAAAVIAVVVSVRAEQRASAAAKLAIIESNARVAREWSTMLPSAKAKAEIQAIRRQMVRLTEIESFRPAHAAAKRVIEDCDDYLAAAGP